MQKNEANNEREHLLRCLARHLLRMSLVKRRAFIDNHEKNKGGESVEKLKQYLKEESEKLIKARANAKKEIGECLNKSTK